MKHFPTYFGIWFTNTAVFFLTAILAPQSVVLGNAILSPFAAAVISGFLLTVMWFATDPLVSLLNLNIKREKFWIIVYWTTNSIGVWIITRVAVYTGLGITGFWWAIIIGLVATLIQWRVWKILATGIKK